MAIISFKCPACGGPLKWDAAKQRYTCEYCRSEYAESEFSAAEKVEETGGAVSAEEAAHTGHGSGKTGDGQVKVYNCPSCGAQVVTDATTAASFCYYCHNPIVLSDKLSGDFHPDAVIPFAIDEKKAKQIFTDWIGKHRYVPADFYSPEQIEKFSAVYFPYWVYSAKVTGTARGKGERERVWTEGDSRLTETSVYEIHKDGDMPVDNLSRIALKKASAVLCESVAPFDYAKMRPFEYGYLSGYQAEARDIDSKELEDDVRKEITEFAENQLRMEVESQYARTFLSTLSARIRSEEWKYVLMPVWTLTYKGPYGKMYYFSINGDSGKTVGELPVDKKSLIRLFFTVAIPVLIVLILLFHFLG